jgi:hypothetical protein
VRYRHEKYEEKKKQTVQTNLSMFLIKKTSPQPKNMTLTTHNPAQATIKN